jgi:hypothetical protein
VTDRDLKGWKPLIPTGGDPCEQADHVWEEPFPRAQSVRCDKCGCWMVKPWPIRVAPKPEERSDAV